MDPPGGTQGLWLWASGCRALQLGLSLETFWFGLLGYKILVGFRSVTVDGPNPALPTIRNMVKILHYLLNIP